LNVDEFGGGLGVQPIQGGLNDILASYGITVTQSMVLDPQNEPFPTQVARDLGGMQVQEIQALNYPPFVDVRPDGMDSDSPILSGLQAVTLNWVSPVLVSETQNENREATTLLNSSPASWLRTDTNIQPDPQTYPEFGFPVEGQPQAYPLAVSVQGVFESFYRDKASPLAEAATAAEPPIDPNTGAPLELQDVGTLESSPETARLVVIGSGEFLNDIVCDLSNSLSPNRYFNSLQFVQNAVDWSVEDLDLLSIRSRSTVCCFLLPMSEAQQQGWEYGNYIVAVLALVGLGVVWRVRQRNETPMALTPPEALEGAQ
jgi:ABC-2 type transport system permease protein